MSQVRLRFSGPVSLVLAALCVLGTYFPHAQAFGLGGSFSYMLVHPFAWIRLFTWPFVHADTQHLLGNLMLFLILAPNLEQRQGILRFLLCLAGCSLVIGAGHLIFSPPNSVLIGASGWVFMMILLSTFAGSEKGTLPVHALIVACLYGWQEFRAAMAPGNVSHFAHFLGGACGLLFGLGGRSGAGDSGAAAKPSKT